MFYQSAILSVSLVAVFGVVGCTPPPQWYAPAGDKSYQTATLCVSADLAPFVQDAESRWREADARVNMSVKIVTDPHAEDPECDANVFYGHTTGFDGQAGGGVVEVSDNPALMGVVQVSDNPTLMSDMSDLLTHELGHLLTGIEHNPDPASIMYHLIQPGEQEILASDTARLGK